MSEAPHLEAVLFDLDGVITDTATYHFVAWKEIATSLNIPFTESDNEALKGVSRMASLEKILELGNLSLSDDRKKELAYTKNERYKALITEVTEADILPGVIALLDELTEAGVFIGLASASKNARTILERLGIMDRFKVIVDGTNITQSKPHPEVFLKGAEGLGVATTNCIGVEDAASGVEAILSAGMKAVGVGSAEVLQAAHTVVPSLESLTLARLRELL